MKNAELSEGNWCINKVWNFLENFTQFRANKKWASLCLLSLMQRVRIVIYEENGTLW